ncbi:MAG: carboxymuconolactone decarboxylase family protein, partial [Pseudomonadales bacterium]|nr:carboxymuconolactone decarboxylase family protein [Pseudomonadales bacterium]
QIGLRYRETSRGKHQNIFRVLANHEKLAKRWLVFGAHVLSKSTLPPREREIAILRIGWLCQSEYEWGQHVLIGRHVGLTDDEINRVKDGADADGWTQQERLVIRAVDELKQENCVSDDTWNGLKQNWSDQQMIDLVYAVGQYNMVSWALNSFGVPLDEDLPRF